MPTASATRLERTACLVLQIGAIAVVLAAVPFKTFELDRFFVPKELVLYIVALATVLLLLDRAARLALGWIDALLIAFLALGVVSSLFATSHWLALRSFGVPLAGIALYWVARSLAAAGLQRRLLATLAFAVVLGACTGLAQAYGILNEYVSDYLSLARAPGGTFGNRNFLAHLATIGLPTVAALTLTSRRALGVISGCVGMMLLAAAIFLSRTRAAWLALIVVGALLVLALLWRRRVIWQGGVRGRAVVLVIAAGIGVLGALFLPNQLNWRSDNPYLESAVGVVNYHEGSGHGRLVQYRNSMQMALAHPVLGVGPGNWPVIYPKYASRNDPSLNDAGMTDNPWPSSDWVAFISERGIPATALLAVALAAIAISGLSMLGRARDAAEALAGLALASTVVATVVVGAFDAVLLLAAPALIAWPLIGAWSTTRVASVSMAAQRGAGAPRAWMAAAGVVGAVYIVVGAALVTAMSLSDGSTSLRTLEAAARMAPGSYRLQMRAAQAAASRGSCRGVLAYAGAARSLFPNAAAPKRLLARCR